MPQIDLSSVCGGGDRNIAACDTIAGDYDLDDSPPPPPGITVPDYAPESFSLSKDAELDWLDQIAFTERKDSGKGSVISIPNSVSSSQRYSLIMKSKASMIGLPKPQKPNYVDRRTCRPANIRLFPKRPGAGAVSGRAATVSEPSSPKVSCMGRVRSRKDRSRRGKNRKKITEPGLVKARSIKERKPGFWNNFRFMFRSKANKPGCKGTELESGPEIRNSRWERKRGLASETVTCSSVHTDFNEHPGLRAVKKFASGRRSDAWAGEMEIDGSKSEPLGPSPIWRRRESDPPGKISVGRGWESVGPASV